jgi:hypothetical protein
MDCPEGSGHLRHPRRPDHLTLDNNSKEDSICAPAPARSAQQAAAPSRRSVATEDSACDRWGALGALARSTRCQRPAMPLGSAQLPWSGRCAASRLACARRRGGASPTAPGCAAARCIRALPPCWRARRAYAAPPAQPAGRQDGGPRKQSWPDPLRRRQKSPAKRHHATAPVQGSKRWERNVLPGQGTLGPSWHTPSASHASNSALCRDQITAGRQAHRAAALLYFAAVQGL